MSSWRPSSGVDTARRRAFLLGRARRYFGERGVLEVDTPALSSAAVTDPNIGSLRTDDGLYLHTSPEFPMKRLLAAGYPDIYSICRVFRGGESGRLHLPEFTMVEWYRLDFGLDDIIADTVRFIAAVLDREKLQNSVRILDYRDAFLRTLYIDPLKASTETLMRAAAADSRLKASLGDRRDAWLDLLMATRIAPALDESALTVIRHYPASQAALARLSPDDDSVAERFEVFLGAVELANGYVELTDAREQERRMNEDSKLRASLQRPAVPKDAELLAALSAGLPDCAGVAVGFERLHMIADGTDDIRNVVTFG